MGCVKSCVKAPKPPTKQEREQEKSKKTEKEEEEGDDRSSKGGEVAEEAKGDIILPKHGSMTKIVPQIIPETEKPTEDRQIQTVVAEYVNELVIRVESKIATPSSSPPKDICL